MDVSVAVAEPEAVRESGPRLRVVRGVRRGVVPRVVIAVSVVGADEGVSVPRVPVLVDRAVVVGLGRVVDGGLVRVGRAAALVVRVVVGPALNN